VPGCLEAPVPNYHEKKEHSLLKLKRVEIQGFKSFVDRTEMRFNGAGIAAIVGPNGCGKSNLSDAISWVLGEQSAKSLRGARMEDVIFAGTRDRKPVGLASVTMTLVDPDFGKAEARVNLAKENLEIVSLDPEAAAVALAEVQPVNGEANGQTTNGHTNGHGAEGVNGGTGNKNGKNILFAANGEITITRRLYRSGESEYLINGRAARLRDIQDIFMGSGLGPESYAIIEQGRIGQILSNKPQDRRAIIEEAAGITKFKTKKRLAEAKLEGAKQNLSRVFDILEEVSRQVNSLKRQATKAKRHEEIREEMVAHLKTAIAGRYRILEREATKLALDLNLASNEYQEFSTQVTERETALGAVRQQFFETEQFLTAERAKLSETKLEAERTRSKLELQSKQVSTIDERVTVGSTESAQIEQRLAQLQIDSAAQRDSLAELNQVADAARTRMTNKNQEREVLQRNLRERESSIETSRQAVLRLLGESSTLKNQLAQVEEYLSGVDRDMVRLTNDEQTASAELERIDSVRNELTGRMSDRQTQLQSVTDRRKAVEADLQQRRQMSQDSRRKLEQLRAELSRQKARRDSLEEVISHRSYTTESVKRLFKAIEQGKVQGLKPIGVLADFVEVTDHTFEKAMEVFLHEELEYVVVPNWSDAETGVELMRTGVDGRATFLVEPSPETALGAGRPPDQPGVPCLSDILRFTNGLTQAPPQILPRLANCFLVDERETASKLSVQYPDSYFLTPDGISYHGLAVSGGKKTGSGPLALKRELKELTQFVDHRQKEVNETTAQMEALEADIQRLTEELEGLRQQQQTQEKDALVLDQEFRKLKDEQQRATQKLSVAKLELDRLRKEQQRAAEVRERNTKLVSEKESARKQHEETLEAARIEISEMQQQFTKVTEEHAQLRAEMAGLEERRRGEQSTQSRVENQMRDLSGRFNTLVNELERLADNRKLLLANNSELDVRAKELAEEIQAREKVTAELTEKEAALRTQLSAAEEALKQLRGEAQSSQEKRSATELQLVRRQADLKYLEETARKELNVAAADLIQEGDDNEISEEVLVEAEAKYQEARTRIDAMGAVNPQALEEFQEAQQRYDFLNTQRQDLLDSIRDTEKAISEIDVESRKRFTDAFEIINANFREMFKTLFGGGVGEMRLTDESNVNESGIDIVASPPGKKLQSVLLLSGGEKSLTAMALLMAIFQYQPSPFCVLDEVDAPLDEPNIMRLTNLLKEMSQNTQFVVITHSKRTMESAQALYGVTMQEPGVSKLVSVLFQPPPQQAELALQQNAASA
jgi:chromosome segregation protein